MACAARCGSTAAGPARIFLPPSGVRRDSSTRSFVFRSPRSGCTFPHRAMSGVGGYGDSSAAKIGRLTVIETPAESIAVTVLTVRVLNTNDVIVATRAGLERFELLPHGALRPIGVLPTTVSMIASNGHYIAGA